MYPDDVLWDDNGSRLVDTTTGPPAVGVDPIVRPMSVTLTFFKLGHDPDFNVSTMLEARLVFDSA